jgi:DNA repair photolyase
MDLLRYKLEVKRKIERLLSRDDIRIALKDHHAHRRPRPCGMTIHTGIGCNLRCTYCYIEDMGFPWSARPYPLTGLQLIYALASNPYFLPGRNGTLIAIGSVTEPFLGITREKTFEYIEAISKYLGNPIQFSTKMYLSIKDAERLRGYDPGISPLVTIITIKHKNKLEPLAPPVSKRFETINNLRKAGLKPILFLRPIIPGIIEDEYIEILEEARRNGAVGVVIGSLRVTNRILERLRKAGLDISEIKRRLPRKPHGNEQVSIYTRDLKEEITRYAWKIGLIPFPEACMANLYTHERVCWKMVYYGIRIPGKEPPRIDRDILDKIASENGLVIENMSINKYYLRIKVSGNKLRKRLFLEYVKCSLGICIKNY